MKTLTEVLAEELEVRHGRVENWAKHIAAAYREARTITTRADLDDLPLGAVIRDDDNAEMLRGQIGDRSAWFLFGSEDWIRVNGIMLPALVLWLPEDDS